MTGKGRARGGPHCFRLSAGCGAALAAGLLLWWGGGEAAAQNVEPAAQDAGPAPSAPAEPDAAEPSFWFPVGERLTYKIYWGVVPVAESSAVTEWDVHEGKRVLAIRFRTRSNSVLRKIYPVDDRIESLVDPETFLPVQFTKNLKEGRYKAHEITTFDHAAGTARWVRQRDGKVEEYAIDPDTRDIVSFMYAMRQEPLPIGERRQFRVMADEKLYDLFVKAVKEEDVKLRRFGKVRTVRIEPEAKFQGLFVRKGKMDLWVSTDDRRIIAKAAIKVPVASVKLLIDKVEGPGDDAWANPKEDEPEERRARSRRRR